MKAVYDTCPDTWVRPDHSRMIWEESGRCGYDLYDRALGRALGLPEAGAILREEFAKAGLSGKVWQFFTVVPDMRATGVRGGRRAFDWPVLKKVTDRILSEVPGVCRVLYDLTPKPVGTIEWE